MQKNHTVQKMIFSVDYHSESTASAMQDFLTNQYYSFIEKTIDEVFDRYGEKNMYARQVTIDLGVISEREFEKKLPALIRKALEEKFHIAIQRQKLGVGTSEFTIVDESETIYNSLIQLLETGIVEWTAESLFSKKDIAQWFTWLKQENIHLFQKLRSHISNTPAARIRLINQLKKEDAFSTIIAQLSTPEIAKALLHNSSVFHAILQKSGIETSNNKTVLQQIIRSFIIEQACTEIKSTHEYTLQKFAARFIQYSAETEEIQLSHMHQKLIAYSHKTTSAEQKKLTEHFIAEYVAHNTAQTYFLQPQNTAQINYVQPQTTAQTNYVQPQNTTQASPNFTEWLQQNFPSEFEFLKELISGIYNTYTEQFTSIPKQTTQALIQNIFTKHLTLTKKSGYEFSKNISLIHEELTQTFFNKENTQIAKLFSNFAQHIDNIIDIPEVQKKSDEEIIALKEQHTSKHNTVIIHNKSVKISTTSALHYLELFIKNGLHPFINTISNPQETVQTIINWAFETAPTSCSIVLKKYAAEINFHILWEAQRLFPTHIANQFKNATTIESYLIPQSADSISLGKCIVYSSIAKKTIPESIVFTVSKSTIEQGVLQFIASKANEIRSFIDNKKITFSQNDYIEICKLLSFSPKLQYELPKALKNTTEPNIEIKQEIGLVEITDENEEQIVTTSSLKFEKIVLEKILDNSANISILISDYGVEHIEKTISTALEKNINQLKSVVWKIAIHQNKQYKNKPLAETLMSNELFEVLQSTIEKRKSQFSNRFIALLIKSISEITKTIKNDMHHEQSLKQQISFTELENPSKIENFTQPDENVSHTSMNMVLLHILFEKLTAKTITANEKEELATFVEKEIRNRTTAIAHFIIGLSQNECAQLKTIIHKNLHTTIAYVRNAHNAKLTPTQPTDEVAAKINQQNTNTFDENCEVEYYVENAGIMLLSPYLTQLFKRLQLVEDNAFTTNEAREKAILLLEYLGRRNIQLIESQLILNKILVGLEPNDTIAFTGISLQQSEKDMCDGLLDAVIKNWGVLKGSTRDNLRGSFFMRSGKLYFKEKTWNLKVENKAYDLLVDKLPWSIATIRLPWMKYAIQTEWR